MNINIKKVAYSRFQLFWLMEHGFTMNDLFKAFTEAAAELLEGEEDIYEGSLRDTFEEFGLGNGSLYPCFGEFLDNEYRDCLLMRQILDDGQWQEYVKDMELSSRDIRRCRAHIPLDTPHGTILAVDKDDPEYPGIELFFAPNGEDPWDINHPGCILEYNPTYRGGVSSKPALKECTPTVVLWVYGKGEEDDEPCASFEME